MDNISNLQCKCCGNGGLNKPELIDGLCHECAEIEAYYCTSCGAMFELECCCDSDE